MRVSNPLSTGEHRAAAAELWAARIAAAVPLPPPQIPPCALCRAYLAACARPELDRRRR